MVSGLSSPIDLTIFRGIFTLRDYVVYLGMLFSERFCWIFVPWPVATVLLATLVGMMSVCLRLLKAFVLSNFVES